MGVALTRLDTPLGEMVLVAANGAVRVLEFADQPERVRRALGRHPDAVPHPAPSPHAAALGAYFAGQLEALDTIPVEPAGTAFQRLAWSALRRVPAGSPCSYAELARRIGRPEAVRAVGTANGANPVSIIVPCHRLLGTGGALTGYGGGLERKAWLLEHERRWAAVTG